MLKIIVILGLISTAFVLYQRLLANVKNRLLTKERSKASPADSTVLKCELCGLFVPETQSIVNNDLSFCSPEHAALFKQKKQRQDK